MATDPILESYGNAIQQETIIHLDSESSSESISQHQESLRVATLSPTCLKSPVLLKSRRLSVFTTSSTNSSNPMVMVSVTMVSLPSASSALIFMTTSTFLRAKLLLLPLMIMKSLSIQKMLSMSLDLKNGRIYQEGS